MKNLLVTTAFLAAPVAANATLPLECADLTKGRSYSYSGFMMMGAYAAVSLKAGETLTLTYAITGTEHHSIYPPRMPVIAGPATSGVSCNHCGSGPLSLTAPADGNYNVYMADDRPGSATLTCTPVNQGPGDDLIQAQNRTAVTANQGSQSAIGSAIQKAISGSGASVNGNGAFVSSQGEASSLRAWAALQARGFDGDLEGRLFELTFGGDLEVSRSTRLGLILSGSRGEFDTNDQDTEVSALSFGPYLSYALSDRYDLNAWMVYARPDYEVDGTDYQAERWLGGLSVNARYEVHTLDLQSFAALSGYREDHPSSGPLSDNLIEGATASLGTQVWFNRGKDFRPYVSLGADLGFNDDTLNDRSEYASARGGFGFAYALSGGTLNFNADVGRIDEDIRDGLISLSYQTNF